MIVLYRGIELAFLGYHPVISTECSCCYLVIKCPFERWCLWRTSHSLCSIFFLWHDCFGSCFIIRFLCSVWTSIILTPLMLTFTQLCFSDRSWTHNWKTIWSSDVNVLWAMQGGTRKHWTLYHPELFLWETKEEISPRFSNQEQLCFYWKTDLISYYGPCESGHGSCIGHWESYLRTLILYAPVIQCSMCFYCAYHPPSWLFPLWNDSLNFPFYLLLLKQFCKFASKLLEVRMLIL